MSARILVSGIILVIMLCVFVFMVELFIPVNASIEFKSECRKALMKMEIEGGLSEDSKDSLNRRLSALGFFNVGISGTSSARQGEDINLEVEAEYACRKFVGLFSRAEHIRKIRYVKTSVSRLVLK